MANGSQPLYTQRINNYSTNSLGDTVWDYNKKIDGLDPGAVIEWVDKVFRNNKIPIENYHSDANKGKTAKIFGSLAEILTEESKNYIWNNNGNLSYEIKCFRGHLIAKVWSKNKGEVDRLRRLLEPL